MITAAEARKRTGENRKKTKWNILDAIQLKLIELKIKFWSGFGRDYIFFDFFSPRPLVRKNLEENGFKFVAFGGANVVCNGFTWRKEKK